MKKTQKSKKARRKKIQFSFSAETVGILNWLKKKTDAPSWAKVVRDALCIYWRLVEMISSGGEICHFDKNGKQTRLIFPDIRKQ